MKPVGLGIAFLAALVSGCAANPRIETGTISGKPEVLFASATSAAVRNRIVEHCSNMGMDVAEATEQLVTCDFEARFGDQLVVALFVNGSANASPKNRLRFTLIQQGGDVRVIARQWVETQMPFGQVRSIELNHGERFAETQELLNLWAGGPQYCRAQKHPANLAACDRVHPGWRTVQG